MQGWKQVPSAPAMLSALLQGLNSLHALLLLPSLVCEVDTQIFNQEG